MSAAEGAWTSPEPWGGRLARGRAVRPHPFHGRSSEAVSKDAALGWFSPSRSGLRSLLGTGPAFLGRAPPYPAVEAPQQSSA